MIFIGLKRSGWLAGLVATAGVMLHYDLKMTGGRHRSKKERRERERREGERREEVKERRAGRTRSACCLAEVI